MSRLNKGWWRMSVAWVVVLTGCHSVSPSNYVAPRVVGRVLDMQTAQPLGGVLVRRAPAEGDSPTREPSHGAHRAEADSGVRTGSDGRFVLQSVRTLTLLGETGWYSVTLALQRSGYQRVMRTYTLADSTNTASGEPLVAAGDILLPRLEK